MNKFQEKCVASIKELLVKKKDRKSIKFEEVIGRKEDYLKSGFQTKSGNHLEVFVYIDEVGFMFGEKDWHICEKSDFRSEEDLIQAFISKLDKYLDK